MQSCSDSSTNLIVVFASAREVSTEAKVADLSVISGDKENISCSQIAMYDAVAVEVSHSLGNLMHQFYDVRHPHLANTGKHR